MTLLVSLASYILASLHLHTSHAIAHIHNNCSFSLHHLTWEFKKPVTISFITLRFIQPKIINELLIILTGASYLGCFSDKFLRAIPVYLGKFTGRTALQRCGAAAAQRKFSVFGFQNQDECWSGAKAHTTYNKYGSQSTCKNGLGGSWGNDVYLMPGDYCL